MSREPEEEWSREMTTLGPIVELLRRIHEGHFMDLEIQRLIENWDFLVHLFKRRLTREMLEMLSTHVFNPHEKVVGNHYPQGWEPKSIYEQASELRHIYPELDFSIGEFYEQRPLFIPNTDIPDRLSDRMFIVPKLSVVGADYPDPFGADYGRILWEIVIPKLQERFGLRIEKGIFFENGMFRMSESTREAWEMLEEAGETDYVCLAAQLGKVYAGASPNYALWQFKHDQPKSIGLGLWFAAHVMLTMPGRILLRDHLGMTCVGDELLGENNEVVGVPHLMQRVPKESDPPFLHLLCHSLGQYFPSTGSISGYFNFRDNEVALSWFRVKPLDPQTVNGLCKTVRKAAKTSNQALVS